MFYGILTIYKAFIAFLALSNLSVAHDHERANGEDYVLCRLCGYNLAPASYLIDVTSPAASLAFNRSLFGVENLKVQTLVNPIGISFDIVTAKGSTCVATRRKWHTDHSWYPGYAWKLCVCHRCLAFIGWVFEPLSTATDSRIYASEKGFYAFEINKILSENCKLNYLSIYVTPSVFSCRFAYRISENIMESVTELTPQQIEFLAQCEKDFANRYTDKDNDYTVVMDIGISSPPLVEPWRPRVPSTNHRNDKRSSDNSPNRSRKRHAY